MIKKQTLKEQIYHQIINEIVAGDFVGGQIINEQELVKRYNVSKAPVREALLILSSEGFLENLPRVGYRVISFTMKSVEEIMDFRSVLEDYVLLKGFNNIQKQDIQELKNLVTSHEFSMCDVWQHWDINMNFHLKLASFAKNQYIYKQIQTAMNFLKLAYAQFYWSQWNRASIPNDLKNHIHIIEALEEKDLELARLYLKRDLGDFCME